MVTSFVQSLGINIYFIFYLRFVLKFSNLRLIITFHWLLCPRLHCLCQFCLFCLCSISSAYSKAVCCRFQKLNVLDSISRLVDAISVTSQIYIFLFSHACRQNDCILNAVSLQYNFKIALITKLLTILISMLWQIFSCCRLLCLCMYICVHRLHLFVYVFTIERLCKSLPS